MLKKSLKWLQCSIIILIVALLTGCGQEIVDGVMETFAKDDENINTFYGECIILQYMDDELLCETKYKEWKGKGDRYRIDYKFDITDKYKEEVDNGKLIGDISSGEEIDVTKNNQLVAYVPDADTYYTKTISLADQVNPSVLQGINVVIYYGGPKEYILSSINDMSESHDISIIDNVKLNGYTTQQIIATPKEGYESEGSVEIWVDQDTWMAIKIKSVNGNLTTISEYKYFEINKRIDESKFDMEIPEGANVCELGENLEKVNKEVTLEEATKLLDMPILYLKDSKDIKLKKVNYIEVSNELYPKVRMTYDIRGEEIIIENSPASSLQQSLDVGYEKIMINDVEGIYAEQGPMKLIEFTKDDILCDIYVKNSEVTKESLVYWSQKLEKFTE